MDQLLEVDTLGTCLICLKICDDDDKLQTENLGRSAAVQGISDTTLKLFLRYLQIDISKLTESTDSLSISARVGSLFCRQRDGVPPTMTMEENTVATCSRCSSVMNDFLTLFQSFEKVRLRLAECVETVHELIKEGESDEERVREFRRRKMTAAPTTQSLGGDGEGGSRDVLKLKLNVERLRREALEKCALRQKQSIPQIVVKRQSIDEDANGGNSPSSEDLDQDLDDEDEELTNEFLLTDTEDDEEGEVPPEERSTQSSTDVGSSVHPLGTVSYGEPGSDNNVTKYRCPSCPLEFFRVETLLEHEENFHSSNEYFALEFYSLYGKLSCVRSSSTRPPQHHNIPAKKSKPSTPPSQKERNFSAVSIGLPNGRYKCKVCERQFTSSSLCYEHYKDQHKEKCFKCSLCGELFPSQLHRKRYEEHLLLAHPLQTRPELPKYTSGQQLEQVLAAICEEKRFIPSSSSFYGCPACPHAVPVNKLKLHLLQCHMDEIVKGVTTLHEKRASGESECPLCSKEVDYLQLHMMVEHPSATMRGLLPPQTSEQDLEAALRMMDVGRNVVWKGKKKMRKHQSCAYCHKSYFYSARQTGVRNHILEKHFDQVLKTLQTMKPNSSPALPDPVQPMQVEESTKPVKEKDMIIERLSEAENEMPLPLEVKIEECDMGEVKFEENEDLTSEQDPLAI